MKDLVELTELNAVADKEKSLKSPALASARKVTTGQAELVLKQAERKAMVRPAELVLPLFDAPSRTLGSISQDEVSPDSWARQLAAAKGKDKPLSPTFSDAVSPTAKSPKKLMA